MSAVGHETDFTICDFVSDLRAPTPSAAAELVYPSEVEILSKIDSLNIRLNTSILNIIQRRKQYLESLKKSRLEKTPQDLIIKYRLMTDNLTKNLETNMIKIITGYKANYEKQVALLDSLSPLKTMSRGYSVTTNMKGKVISKIKDVAIGEDINIKVMDGNVLAKVQEIK